MKIIFLNPHHHKNTDAIKRMCKKLNIELEITEDFNRCKTTNYNILISNQKFFNPTLIPKHIKIIFGPQFFPENEIIGNINSKYSERCVYNSLSEWVNKFILDTTNGLVIPINQFPFSVNTEKFHPNDNQKTLDCLLYFKHRDPQLLSDIKTLLERKLLSYKVFSYGSYHEEDYINTLQKSKFMLTLDAHESQGFALQEAMACNVPLLVFDIKTVYEEHNSTFFNKYKPLELKATSVPYWSEKCGLKNTELEEVPALLDEMMLKYQTFEPRQFILDNLSEEVCMKRILDWYHK
jgi:hypothetical protein